MRLSHGIEVNKQAVKFSYCGNYVACGFQNDLKIIRVKSSEVIATFTCTHSIKTIDWLRDSDHVLCVLDKVSKVQAFSLSEPEWVCAIEEGEPGLETAVWSPKGCHILTLAEFNVRISVWSLTGRSVAYINNPILRKTNEFSFSPDGNYFAVIVGQVERYRILIFSTFSWIVKQEIQCTCNVSIPSNPLWSPTNMHIVIWETVDFRTAFLEVYSLEKSKLIGSFKKSDSHGLFRISKVSWVASGQFLLVGCLDDCIYVLNYITWNVLSTLEHSQVIADDCQVYEECETENDVKLIKQRPVTLSRLRPVVKAGAALPGVSSIVCDYRGRYVATQSSSMPAVVWIWKVGSFSLKAVVVLNQAVSDFKWNFDRSELLICSNSKGVLLWRPEDPVRAQLISSDDDLLVGSCLWCPGSGDFAVIGTSFMYIVYDFDEFSSR